MKTKLTFIIIATGLAIIIPVTLYWWNFKSQSISNVSADWGTFGDFIGGTINSVVGIVSLIVLTWLTLIVAKNSNEESRKQQLVLRRMDAYRVLVDFVPKYNLLPHRIRMHYDYIHVLLENLETVPVTDRATTVYNLKLEFYGFTEMCEMIRSFPVCYGYLFNYDFDSTAFKKLLQSSQETLKGINEIEKSLFNADNTVYTDTIDFSIEFMEDFTEFINALLKELVFE